MVVERRAWRISVSALLFVLLGCDGQLSVDSTVELEGLERPPAMTPVDPQDRDPIPTTQEFTCVDDVRDPGPALVRRLTVEEYIATIEAGFALDVSEEAIQILPPDLRADGFRNTAYALNVDLEHIDAYAQMAEQVASAPETGQLIAARSDCQQTDDACLDSFLQTTGRWIMRGELSPVEQESLLKLGQAVREEGGDFDEVSRAMVEAMLQSPRFLYRVENQRGDGEVRQLGSFEIASRLSYLIWGASPDEPLFEAAANDALQTRAQIEAQVERMLQDPRARETTLRFAHDWLALSRLSTLEPNAEHFPDWRPQLAEDMHRETMLFIEHILWEQRRPVGDLFSAQVTFVTPALADYYGLPAVQGPGASEVNLEQEPSRGGLLTQGSVLTVGGYEASMVARGLFLLNDVLCGQIGDPPPGVDTTPPAIEPGLSQRSIAEDRVADGRCGGCHIQFEPLAYGREKYDGLGAYHDVDEQGNMLREDGELVVPGELGSQPFETTGQLGDLLSQTARVEECFTLKVTQYALGRSLLPSDRCLLAEVREQMEQQNSSYAGLITSIATSDLVLKTQTER